MKIKISISIIFCVFFLTTLSVAQQDIRILADQVEVPSGTGSFDFGDAYVKYAASYFFLIENVGDADLTLDTTTPISIGGTDPSSFTTSVDLNGQVIPAGGLLAFDINVLSTTSGSKNIVVTITSDDPDETNYTFTVSANVLLVPGNCLMPSADMENTYTGSLFQGLFSVTGVSEYQCPSGWGPGFNSVLGALFGGTINVGITSDTHGGSNALELFSDAGGAGDLLGAIACDAETATLKGWYKFAGAPTDQGIIVVSTGGGVETNRTDANSDTLYITTNASVYTQFEIAVPHDANSIDSVLLYFAITNNASGVSFKIDDLELTTSVGTTPSQWSSDPTENTPISIAANDQSLPKSVPDGNGGAIIVWQDYRNSSFDIYAQRIDANGEVQWASDGVAISTAISNQENPAIISDGNGGAIITWQDGRNGGSSQNDIYAQRIDANGVVQWTADGVAITIASDTQENPTIVSDGAGGAIIAWEDDRAVNNLNIFAQRVNSSGVVQWTANGILICGELRHQLTPIIISDGSGGAIITWTDDRIIGTRDVYAQLVNASGVAQWTANGVAISSTPGFFAINLAVTSDGSGGAIITWENNLNPMSVQRIDGNGVLQWSEISISAGRFPSIISDDAGGAIIAYYSGNSVLAQRINASGVTQWAASGEVISNVGGRPVLATDGSGGAIIAWPKNGNFPTYNDIYGQRINASGVVQWTTNGVAISTAVNDQETAFIISDGSGGAIVTWNDERSGTNIDIYAQKVYTDGQLCNSTPPTPGVIAGSSTVFSLSSNTYSVTAVPGADTYTWTLPAGWSGSSTTNSIDATASSTSGDITVTATNSCGTSAAAVLAIVVNPNPQIITFNALNAKTFGDDPFDLAASSDSGLPVSFASSDNTVATVSGTTVTIVGAGTSTIAANQAGNADYSAATDVPQTLTVNQATQTITFNSLANKIIGDAPFDLSSTSSSGLAVTYTSSNPAVATISGITVTIIGAGTTDITASQSGNTNYLAATDLVQTMTVIVKQDQTITFNSISTKTLGDAPFALTATASSSLAVAYSSTSTEITLVGEQVTIVNAGRATITASQAGDANYNAAANEDQSFCINPAKPTVTIGPDSESVTLTSSASSGNQWYENGTIMTGEINGTLTVTTPGIYKVQVTVDDCDSEFSSDVALIVTGDVDTNHQNINSIYPNPAFDELTISLNDFESGKPVAIKIVDMKGSVMTKTEGIGKQESRIDVRSYSMGSYLIIAEQSTKSKRWQFIKSNKK